MPIPVNPYPAPGPSVGPQAPNYADTYPALGLSGLAQGFTHGLELGHEWGHQADELSMRGKQMENEADYRNALIGSRAPLITSEVNKNNALAGAVPEKLALMTKSESDRDANAKAALAAKTAAAGTKNQKALDNAAGAFMAMDNYRDLASKYAPQDSAAGAAIKAPLEWIRSKAMQTSPENNLADKAGQAATLFATAVNSAGGGRMTEAEVDNMKKAMGGNGIGETQTNIAQKHDQMKNELAAKLGLSRQDVDRYIASRAAPTPAAGGADPHAQAVAWAQANPRDPRSAAILKINGQ